MTIEIRGGELSPMTRRRQIRDARCSLEAGAREERADSPPRIVGYGAVFWDPNDAGTEYQLWSDAVERFLPGCFDRALREDDVRALWNHRENQVLGRVEPGTLRLSVDTRGLRYEIDPPETPTAQEAMESIRRRDVSGSSIGFRATSVRWDFLEELEVRNILEVQLFEVSPVTFPAYAGTEAEIRSLRQERDRAWSLRDAAAARRRRAWDWVQRQERLA